MGVSTIPEDGRSAEGLRAGNRYSARAKADDTLAAPSAAARFAAIVVGAVGLYDVLFVATAITGIAILGFRLDVLFLDFFVFHAAARAFLEGGVALVYDTAALTHLQNVLYAARLPYEISFRPFLYPPIWLLDLLPFGFLPIGVAVGSFLALTVGVCAWVLRRLGLNWGAVLAILVSPAAAWVVLAGQNTFLSVALLYGGMALLDRRPVLAGVLLGLLAFKPQVWILVPVALVAARAWRPLFATGVTVIAQSLATFALFGADCWLAFLAAARHASTGAAAAEMYDRVHAQMTTLLVAGKISGLGERSAMALQLAGAALAVGAVIWIFARRRASHERTAILAIATFFVSPHMLNYDLLLLMPAAALLFLNPPPTGYLPGERVIYLALWLVPSFCMTLNHAGLPLTPLLVLSFGIIAWLRLMPRRRVFPKPPTCDPVPVSGS